MSVLVADVPVARSSLDSSWWAGGLTLAERCALACPPRMAVSPQASARAAGRLARWQEMYWFGGLDDVIRSLAGTDVDETMMLALLAEEPKHLAARAARPEWARRAEAVAARAPAAPTLPDPPEDGTVAAHRGLSTIVAPFAGPAADRLITVVSGQPLAAMVDRDLLRDSLIAGLERTLVGLAGRTLVLELNAKRAVGQLAGKTPRDRFWSFVRHFASADGLTGLVQEYPVLARLLVEAADRAASVWAQLLQRLAADRELLVGTMFGGVDPGRLIRAAHTGGEHLDAGHPMVLTFAGGARLTYRPQPVGAHARLGEAIDWLNTALPDLELRTAAAVDRGEYGWLAPVEPREYGDLAAGRRLHYRWGALLALLHAMGGADLHEGALVAAGDEPVLAHVTGPLRAFMSAPGSSTVDADPAKVALDASVRRLGVLPAAACAGTEDADRLHGHPALRWAAPGTDEMRVVRAESGRPSTSPVSLADADSLRTAMLAGFRAAYDTLAGSGDELRVLRSRYASAGACPGVRSAIPYTTMLFESTHPDVLRDALDRDRILGLLSVTGAGQPAQERLLPSELAALRAGTAPWIASCTGSGDLPVGEQRELNPGDRAAQEWILRAWLAEDQTPQARTSEVPRTCPARRGADPHRCLALASAIAVQLSGTAYRQGGRIAWLGLTTLDEQRWKVRPLGVGLYDGYPGVALFLAKLAELTGQHQYAELARGALAHVPAMLADLHQPAVEPPRCGPFHGVTGLAYGLVQVAASLRDTALLDAVLPPIAAAAMTASSDNEPGVLGGQAGGAAAMLALDAAIGSPAARRVAAGCAQRIIAHMAPGDDAGPWSSVPATAKPAVGFASGASGIGWALLRYAKATGDSRAAEAGLTAFPYERELGPPADCGWCRGAAGVGLARIEALRTGQVGIAEDIDKAVRAVVSTGPLGDHSLCHGELGCLELLMAAARTGYTDAATALGHRVAWLLDDVERNGPRCGTPAGVPTPGLMTGLAGIGYGLLRLAFPDQVPAVLLLDPPPVGSLPAFHPKGARR